MYKYFLSASLLINGMMGSLVYAAPTHDEWFSSLHAIEGAFDLLSVAGYLLLLNEESQKATLEKFEEAIRTHLEEIIGHVQGLPEKKRQKLLAQIEAAYKKLENDQHKVLDSLTLITKEWNNNKGQSNAQSSHRTKLSRQISKILCTYFVALKKWKLSVAKTLNDSLLLIEDVQTRLAQDEALPDLLQLPE